MESQKLYILLEAIIKKSVYHKMRFTYRLDEATLNSLIEEGLAINYQDYEKRHDSRKNIPTGFLPSDFTDMEISDKVHKTNLPNVYFVDRHVSEYEECSGQGTYRIADEKYLEIPAKGDDLIKAQEILENLTIERVKQQGN